MVLGIFQQTVLAVVGHLDVASLEGEDIRNRGGDEGDGEDGDERGRRCGGKRKSECAKERQQKMSRWRRSRVTNPGNSHGVWCNNPGRPSLGALARLQFGTINTH